MIMMHFEIVGEITDVEVIASGWWHPQVALSPQTVRRSLLA